LLSEFGLEKHGSSAYESGGFGAKLDNFVPNREKGRARGICEELELLGKRARNAEERLMGDNFLCRKTWVAQLKDLEDMFLQV
jgi:hypothetical protein